MVINDRSNRAPSFSCRHECVSYRGELSPTFIQRNPFFHRKIYFMLQRNVSNLASIFYFEVSRLSNFQVKPDDNRLRLEQKNNFAINIISFRVHGSCENNVGKGVLYKLQFRYIALNRTYLFVISCISILLPYISRVPS